MSSRHFTYDSISQMAYAQYTANSHTFFLLWGVITICVGYKNQQGGIKISPGKTRDGPFSTWRPTRIGEKVNFGNFGRRNMYDSSNESY